MASITINTTAEEQARVLQAVRVLQGQTVSMSAIASMAGMNPNRVRYVMTDLVESGKVIRHASKSFNKHYIRYSYEVANG